MTLKQMEMERVQAIAVESKSKDTIPSVFILSEDEQPAITTIHGTSLQVPVVDLGEPDEQNLVRLISEAGQDWGIFQVVNHGIPDDVIRKLQEVGKEFFEVIPQEEKELIAKPLGYQGVEGYGSQLQKEVEGKKGWVDHLFHKIWPPSAINYQFWPENPPSYREANEEYAKRLRVVVDKLLMSLSMGLGLKRHELKDAVGGEELIYLMKINYYPPCPRPDLALGVVAHTDMCTLTILVSNQVQGLQVFKDDHWYDVDYIPNALVIHIGDQIEVLSDGRYKSVLHRTTVNKERTRMSWPVFLEPPLELEIGPLLKLMKNDGQQKPSKYKTKKYKDYLYCKLNKLPQ